MHRAEWGEAFGGDVSEGTGFSMRVVRSPAVDGDLMMVAASTGSRAISMSRIERSTRKPSMLQAASPS